MLSENATRRHIVELSYHFEQDYDPPWTLDKLTEDHITAMLRAIRIVSVQVTSVFGHQKLAQHKFVDAQSHVFEHVRMRLSR